MPTINVTNATVTGTITYDEPAPPNGGGGGDVRIDFVRSVASRNEVFSCHNGETTTANHLVVIGSSAQLPDLVIDGGSPQQPARTDGDGWCLVMNELADGPHRITAGGTEFRFTIAPSLTDLPVKVGGNLGNGQSFSLDGQRFAMQNDSSNSKAAVVQDLHTLHFMIRPEDAWYTYNRDEASSQDTFTNGQTLNVAFEFMLDPAYGQFNNAAGAVTVWQVHENDSAPVPCLTQGRFDANASDTPNWAYDNGNNGQVWVHAKDHGLRTLERGVWHTTEFILAPKDGKGGVVKHWLNGVLYVDGGNMQGSGGNRAVPYYWKFGLYRGSANNAGQNPPNNETQAMMFRNMQIKYT